MTRANLVKLAKSWLPLAAVATILCGLIYAAFHQSYRQQANDPQIQLASDAVTDLKGGANPLQVINAKPVDPAFSLSPFVMVFDDTGQMVAAGVTLADSTPLPPAGVLAHAKKYGEHRVTWQPAGGVRIAAVVRYVGEGKGYVLAGRSLGEIEARVWGLALLVGTAWALALIASFAIILIL